MKTVALIHKDHPQIGTFIPAYELYYKDLFVEGAKRGIRFCEASTFDFLDSAGVFARVRLNDGTELHNFRPDLVWHKNSAFHAFVLEISASFGRAVLNRPSVALLCRDKFVTSQKFSDLMPRTLTLVDALENPSLLDAWRGNTVVIKPRMGSSGYMIALCEKSDLAARVQELAFALPQRFVVQEFLDSTCGIPGVVDGVHDFRTVFLGQQPSHHAIRVPKAGDFRCNVGAGGTKLDIPYGEVAVPPGISAILSRVSSTLGDGFYSVDTCLDVSGRAYLVEINNSPAIRTTGRDGKMFGWFHKNIVLHLEALMT